MFFITLFFLFIFGVVLGSFASAIIYRERQGLSWFVLRGEGARSFCPQCHVMLQVKDLIPLFSWIFQKGACRYCKDKIPFSYILLELFSGAVLVGFYVLSGALYLTLMMAVMVPFLLSFGVLLLRYRLFSRRLFYIILGLEFLSVALTFLIYPIMG